MCTLNRRCQQQQKNGIRFTAGQTQRNNSNTARKKTNYRIFGCNREQSTATGAETMMKMTILRKKVQEKKRSQRLSIAGGRDLVFDALEFGFFFPLLHIIQSDLVRHFVIVVWECCFLRIVEHWKTNQVKKKHVDEKQLVFSLFVAVLFLSNAFVPFFSFISQFCAVWFPFFPFG